MADSPTAARLIAKKYECDGATVVETYQHLSFSKHIALMSEHTDLRPGTKVLDVGCGTGKLLVELCQVGAEVTGIDTFEEAEGIDRQIAEARLTEHGFTARLVTGTATDMPFGNESFDLVVTIGMLEHISPAVRPVMLREMFRVLNPGGIFS